MQVKCHEVAQFKLDKNVRYSNLKRVLQYTDKSHCLR